MITALEVPFRDARAADLAFRLVTHADAARPALARLELRLGEVSMELCILGGSHEARVSAGGVTLSEVVACDTPGATALPPRLDTPAAAGTYRFRARTLRLAPAALSAMATRLIARVGASPRGIVGRFPGHPAALTALLAAPAGAGVGWETWHLYPAAGELVRTTSVLAPRGAGVRP